MITMMWHGHRVRYGPPHGNKSAYCIWIPVDTTRAINRYDVPWPPPRPGNDYVCPYQHKACSSWPTATNEEIRSALLDLLHKIGAQPGEYTLKGEVLADPRYAATVCVLHEEITLT